MNEKQSQAWNRLCDQMDALVLAVRQCESAAHDSKEEFKAQVKYMVPSLLRAAMAWERWKETEKS